MNYLIAVDTGGTKTNTILFDETGHILLRDMSPGCNPLDIGLETARHTMLKTLQQVAAQAPGPVSCIYAGIAGTFYLDGDFFSPDLLSQLPSDRVLVDDDGRSILSSELSPEVDGCSMICGTGCSVWVRKKELPRLVHRGGWGYLIDTLGSGYSLGRNAFRAVCLEADDRGPATMLTKLITQELGKPPIPATPELYAGGRSRIASLAHTVFDAAKQGDAVALELLDEGASSLAELLWSADKFFTSPYPVILGGGIVSAFPEYVSAIRSRAPKNAHLILADTPPVYGSAVEAMRGIGLSCSDSFRSRFLADYRSL